MLHGKECALGFSREKELIGYIERFSMRDWLTGLWRLRSPTVCHRQAKDLGKPVVRFQFKLGPGNITLISGARFHNFNKGFPRKSLMLYYVYIQLL